LQLATGPIASRRGSVVATDAEPHPETTAVQRAHCAIDENVVDDADLHVDDVLGSQPRRRRGPDVEDANDAVIG
jgi:hypothetical protein